MKNIGIFLLLFLLINTVFGQDTNWIGEYNDENNEHPPSNGSYTIKIYYDNDVLKGTIRNSGVWQGASWDNITNCNVIIDSDIASFYDIEQSLSEPVLKLKNEYGSYYLEYITGWIKITKVGESDNSLHGTNSTILKFVNNTSSTLSIAYAKYANEYDGWQSTGWFNVEAYDSKEVNIGDYKSRIYVFAGSNGFAKQWGGGTFSFCVDTQSSFTFSNADKTECSSKKRFSPERNVKNGVNTIEFNP